MKRLLSLLSIIALGLTSLFGCAKAVPPPSTPVQPPAAAVREQSLWLAREGGAKVPEGKIALTRMTIEADVVEMVFTGSFFYEVHIETKPSRLEIVIPGAVNGLDVDGVTVNRMGIATVRLESRPDVLRFVLYPAAGYPLPSRIDVTNNFRGLLIHAAPPGKK